MKIVARNETDLASVATEVMKHLGDRKIIALKGQMGAGKTTFIRYLCRTLEVKDEVSSPTYGYVNEYESPYYGPIYHFDLYRLESIEQAFDIGIEEYIYSGSLCIIEWPEMIQELLNEDTFWIEFNIALNGDREIRFDELQ